MSLAEDLLNSLPEDQPAVTSADPATEPHIIINADKTVTVPEELKRILVQHDHNIETVTFDCPRYWDGHDLSQMGLRIVFQRSDGHKEPHPVENLRIDDSNDQMIHFDWTISGNVTLVSGNVKITVCAKLTDAEGVSEREWHTIPNQDLFVNEGMDCSGEEIVERNPDVIEYILAELDNLKENPPASTPGSSQNLNLTVETITVGEDSGGDDGNDPVSVTGLSLDLTSYSAKVGGGFYINPVVLPTNATNRSVTWQSNKPAVATVNTMGYVECIAEGDAVITCTTVDGGYTATCAVSVAAAESGGDTGGDSGGDSGGATGQKIQFSSLEIEDKFMKADGTLVELGSTYHVQLPYTEGMFISTGSNASWNKATYPAMVVFDGEMYTIPDYTVSDKGTVTVGGKLPTQITATLTGFPNTAVVYVSFLAGGLGATLDNAGIYYYIPGGES